MGVSPFTCRTSASRTRTVGASTTPEKTSTPISFPIGAPYHTGHRKALLRIVTLLRNTLPHHPQRHQPPS